MRGWVGTKPMAMWVCLLLICLGQAVQFYQSEQYDGIQAKEWLWRARATNDLNDMAKYLIKSEEILQDYHGNPGWPYPTPDTDFDFIRTNINETIMNCYKWSGNTTSDYAYQQAVHNLQETIVEIAEHLDNAVGQMGSNPGINPLGYVVWNLLWAFPLITWLGWWRLEWFDD